MNVIIFITKTIILISIFYDARACVPTIPGDNNGTSLFLSLNLRGFSVDNSSEENFKLLQKALLKL